MTLCKTGCKGWLCFDYYLSIWDVAYKIGYCINSILHEQEAAQSDFILGLNSLRVIFCLVYLIKVMEKIFYPGDVLWFWSVNNKTQDYKFLLGKACWWSWILNLFRPYVKRHINPKHCNSTNWSKILEFNSVKIWWWATFPTP